MTKEPPVTPQELYREAVERQGERRRRDDDCRDETRLGSGSE